MQFPAYLGLGLHHLHLSCLNPLTPTTPTTPFTGGPCASALVTFWVSWVVLPFSPSLVILLDLASSYTQLGICTVTALPTQLCSHSLACPGLPISLVHCIALFSFWMHWTLCLLGWHGTLPFFIHTTPCGSRRPLPQVTLFVPPFFCSLLLWSSPFHHHCLDTSTVSFGLPALKASLPDLQLLFLSSGTLPSFSSFLSTNISSVRHLVPTIFSHPTHGSPTNTFPSHTLDHQPIQRSRFSAVRDL